MLWVRYYWKLRRGIEASVLYQQDPGSFGNTMPAVGKVSFSTSPCNKQVAPLLLNSHGVCANRTPLTVAIEEVWFHGKNSEVGDEDQVFDVRYKLRNVIKEQVLADFMAEFTPQRVVQIGFVKS